MNTLFYFSFTFLLIAIATVGYRKRERLSLLIDTFSLFLYLLMTIVYLSANFFTGHGVDEAVIYTLQYGLGKAGFGDYILLIFATVSALVAVFALAYLYYRVLKRISIPKPRRIKGFIHKSFMILAFLFHPLLHNLYKIASYRLTAQSGDFLDYYKKPPLKVDIGNPKNIVYIYAESLERTYFDDRLFPNLLERLDGIRKNSTEFSDIRQIIGSGWTIGGMVTSQCSIPLFTPAPAQGNSMSGMSRFLGNAVCLGDTLKNSGYHLSYIQGADIRFSGKDKFYKTHGFDEIYGRNELIERLRDKKYLNAWGLYDDSTLNIAYEKFEELSKSDKPFALVVMTLDTHHPDGHISKSCRQKGIEYKDGKNKILNALKCSDYLIADFIEKIENSPYADKSIIVLSSDHLAMKNGATSILKRGRRRDSFIILERGEDGYRQISKEGSMLDVAPTLLHLLGAKGVDYGLGRDLFEKESLIGKFEDFDKKLYSWREEILKFWNFPKLPGEIEVELKAKKVSISTEKYSFPILLRISPNGDIQPIFDSFAPKKLHSYLPSFDRRESFLWIDLCQRISYAFDTNESSKYCIATGRLDGDIKVEALQKSKERVTLDRKTLYGEKRDTKLYNERIERLNKLDNIEILSPSFDKASDRYYEASLEDGIDFSKKGYPSFLERVWGISERESWGRWSDARLYEDVKFQFSKKLPTSFILEMKIGCYGENLGKKLRIEAGSQKRELLLESKSPRVYRIEFSNVDSKSLDIHPPFPSSSEKDPRKLGISFQYLKIVDTTPKGKGTFDESQ